MSWFPEFDGYTKQELDKIRLEFRSVFSSEIGQRVLASILGVLRFYSTAETEEERVLQNAAKKILYLSGAWDEGKEIKILNSLLNGR